VSASCAWLFVSASIDAFDISTFFPFGSFTIILAHQNIFDSLNENFSHQSFLKRVFLSVDIPFIIMSTPHSINFILSHSSFISFPVSSFHFSFEKNDLI
jgi:hypothetical protein